VPPGYEPSAYPPPGYGQPGYGAPAYGSQYRPGAPELAPYSARLGGWIIDFLILGVLDLLVDIPLHQIHFQHLVVRGTHTARYHFGGSGIALNAIIAIVYGGLLCGSSRGQTLGMMVTHTRAVGVGNGNPIGVPRALGRAAFEYLMVIALVVPWIIDMLFPLWDPQKQTLHDKVAGTVVISTE
jgi:uncharacterized RDD family membrane protein YckC